MGGAIIQLIAYGSQNIYLTGDPQITFWKSVYKRYTNFSTESIQQDIIGNLAPGNFVSVVIARNGDLLKGLTLQYNPSGIYNNYVLYPNGGVPSNLGNTIFKQIEIEIGGNLIDRHYGLWLTIWSNLTIQSYIAPSNAVDTTVPYILPVGVEPDVCNEYARMSYNHNQQNTYLDYQFRAACLYSSANIDKFHGTLAYRVNGSTTIPTLGTFDLDVSNINELVTFDNPLNVFFLFFKPTIPSVPNASINYFVQFTGLSTVAGITTFTGCQPYSPSGYPAVAKPIGAEYSVCSTFEVYTGAINPNDNSPAGITNIIPDNSTTSFNIRVNNPTNILFYSTKGTVTIYSGTTGEYYNIQYGSPSGKSKYFAAEGYLLIYDCEVFNPPVAQVSLTNTDLIVPTGTYYGFEINDLLYFDNLINLIPTSNTGTTCITSPFDIFTEFGLTGALPFTILYLQKLDPINGVTYIGAAVPYIGTAIYNPVTQLFYYIVDNSIYVTPPPSVPVSVPNGTRGVAGYYVFFTNGAPSEAYIPLQFWFCRNPGLALPLIALQYHDVNLNVTFSPFTNFATVLVQQNNYNNVFKLPQSIKFYGDYVYLDSIERRQFANNSHEYLIEQLQKKTSQNQNNIKLNFTNPVKEIIISGQPNNPYQLLNYSAPNVSTTVNPVNYVLPLVNYGYVYCNSATVSAITGDPVNVVSNLEYFNKPYIYSTKGYGSPRPIVVSNTKYLYDFGDYNGELNDNISKTNVRLKLVINGKDQFTSRNLKYFTRKTVWETHTGTGSGNWGNIAVIPFSLNPEQYQPSGAVNFGILTDVRLIFENFDLSINEQLNPLEIYALSYNILKISGGMGGVAFS